MKGIVELHGGSVEARSDGLDKGAEFIVTLPHVEPAAQEAPTASPPSAKPTPRRIVIADDNLDAAESLKMLLEFQGHEVRVAGDGREALGAAADAAPDVMLIDIGMPKLNGYEVAGAIRAQPWGGRIKLVAVTGWGQEEDRRRTKAAGFDAHLAKPVDVDALMGLL